MEQPNQNNNGGLREDPSFSLKNEIRKAMRSVAYIIGYWRILALAAIAGLLLGGIYYWFKPVSYISRTTFVVEESKMGGGSIASALAGSLGLDIGSLAGSSSGVLSGDNVLELVKSHNLIRKTLLTPYDSAKHSLADRYAEVRGWKKKWAKSDKVGRLVSFPAGAVKLGRTEDSLLQKIITEIIGSNLSISKPDKKLSFFELSVKMRDETLSLAFSQRLLKEATDFYIETKTRRIYNNVKRLQLKADSLAMALNRKTYSTADVGRQLLDANPVYSAPEANAEISYRDKLMQATVYGEIVKNLEISRTALIQETPTIQIVDDPEIPLKDDRMKLWLALLSGALGAILVASIVILLFRKDKTNIVS